MARVVILSFENNAAANKFVKDINALQNDGASPGAQVDKDEILRVGLLAATYSKLEALLARPTLACECTKGLGIRSQQYKAVAGFGKTAKFGWWVHAACGRPTKMVVDNWIKNLIISGGNNLLGQILTPKGPVEVHVMSGPNPAMFEPGYSPNDPVDHSRSMLEADHGNNVAAGSEPSGSDQVGDGVHQEEVRSSGDT